MHAFNYFELKLLEHGIIRLNNNLQKLRNEKSFYEQKFETKQKKNMKICASTNHPRTYILQRLSILYRLEKIKHDCQKAEMCRKWFILLKNEMINYITEYAFL